MKCKAIWLINFDPTIGAEINKISVIDLFQIRSVSIARFIKQVGIIDEKTMKSALDAVIDVLEIPS
jgi:mRNA-degrading endonuclease toxin of MazEF toxin-antitoxin module